MNDKLLTAEEVAEYLGVATRQVAERYAFMPDFPKAIRLPSPKGQGLKRWDFADIKKWVESLKAAA